MRKNTLTHMSEHQEQCRFFEYLNVVKGWGWDAGDNYMKGNLPKGQPSMIVPELMWVFAIPNGGLRHKAVASKMKLEGVKRGVADIFVPIARGNYHGLFIELKVATGQASPHQYAFGRYVLWAGYQWVIARGAEGAVSALKDYLQISSVIRPENQASKQPE